MPVILHLFLTDPRGQVTTFFYDYELPSDPRYNTKGNLADIYFPPINGQVSVTHLGYNANGQSLLVQDPNGIATQYDYFPSTGYLQRVIQARRA